MVIDNVIYWFGYCVIYKQKKIGYFHKQPIFEKTNIFTYYIYKSILFV